MNVEEFYNSTPKDIRNVLVHACLTNNLDLVEALLSDEGILTNFEERELETLALSTAIITKNHELIDCLVTSAKIINKPDTFEAVHMQAKTLKEKKYLEILLKLVNLRDECYVNFQNTPLTLEWARSRGETELMFAMLTSLHEHNCEISTPELNGALMHFLLNKKEYFDQVRIWFQHIPNNTSHLNI